MGTLGHALIVKENVRTRRGFGLEILLKPKRH